MSTIRRPLTIAHISGELGFSGGEVQVFLLASGLSKRGHRNVLLCPSGSGSFSEARARGLETRPIWIRSEWSPRNAWGVRTQLAELRPDLVFLHTGRANWIGGLAASSLRLPAITTRRMDRSVRRGLRTRWVYGSATRRAVAISDAVRNRLIAGGVDPDRIRVIHSAVDPGALVPQRGRGQTRADAGLDSETPCLLAAAALIPRKGLDVLIDATGRLHERGVDAALWLAGEGPERAALERRAADLGLSDTVHFLGQRNDVPDLIAASDAVVLPSRREGLGVAALEAMAVGRAVVASAVGGLPELVVHGKTGLLVPPDDPDALAAALTTVVEDEGLRRSFGCAGTQRVADEFAPDAMVSRYERLCFEVVAEHARR